MRVTTKTHLNFPQKSVDAINENNFVCGISICLLQNATPFDYLLQLLLKDASRKNKTLRATVHFMHRCFHLFQLQRNNTNLSS